MTRTALIVALNNYGNWSTRYYTLKIRKKSTILNFLDKTFILHGVKLAELFSNSFE